MTTRRMAIAGMILATLAAAPALTGEPRSVETPSERKPSRVIRVGPDRKIASPSQAARMARKGALIEIDAGVYPGDVAVWEQDDLTLRGVGGFARLESGGKVAQGKAIWVIKGDNVRVENIEFSGARASDKNGAGIRQIGANLTVSRCLFHDNQNGILTGRSEQSDIIVEHSEFADNGHGDGKSHNIYIGRVRSFTLRHSYLHGARVGHQVKTRAATSHILYNRIMDGESGNSSYALDFPNGGKTIVIGNLIQQGPQTENTSIVNFASRPQDQRHPGRLFVVNNTIINDHSSGTFIRNRDPQPVRMLNNILAGPGKPVSGEAELAGNVLARSRGLREGVSRLLTGNEKSLEGLTQIGENRVVSDAGFVDAAAGDFRLRSDSAAVDAGVVPGEAGTTSLVPVSQYDHPLGARPRPVAGAIDAGAYERGTPE